MAKARSVYACTECGGESPKWQGQCPHCGAWNTLVEGVAESTPRNRFSGVTKSSELKRLAEVGARRAADGERDGRARPGARRRIRRGRGGADRGRPGRGEIHAPPPGPGA